MKGWKYESYRHYLAARGIKTVLKLKHGHDPDRLFLRDQLQKGAKVEQEHVSSPDIAKQIAKAHLVEDPRYYDKLELIEQKPGMQGSVRGIPIFADKLPENRIYPVTPEDVKEAINQHGEDETRGLVSVRFVNPRDGEQRDAWAQYVRSKREVLIFSQPAENGLIDGQDPLQVRKHIKEYVLPHELGHHEALYVHKITDKDLGMAEARADANVIGMAADDKDVKYLKHES